jgi:hypothetical protein
MIGSAVGCAAVAPFGSVLRGASGVVTIAVAVRASSTGSPHWFLLLLLLLFGLNVE